MVMFARAVSVLAFTSRPHRPPLLHRRASQGNLRPKRSFRARNRRNPCHTRTIASLVLSRPRGRPARRNELPPKSQPTTISNNYRYVEGNRAKAGPGVYRPFIS